MPSCVMRRVAPGAKLPLRRSRVSVCVSAPASSVKIFWMKVASMAEQQGRVGTAKGVAGADHAVVAVMAKGIKRHVGRKRRCPAADRARGTAVPDRRQREGKLNQTTAAKRMPEAALPADQGRTGKNFRESP